MRDPYRIWVSEVMLQQTTVRAVLGRYDAFLARFPDVGALARARQESVLAAWSGLGYYSRARHLHCAAREIVRRHGGRLPRELQALRRLPGFGEYISAAVASLAFETRVAATDANVTRVLSRLFAIPGMVGTRRHAEIVRRHAEALLCRRRPGDVTAALMDLGQMFCTLRRPLCLSCPLTSICKARRMGESERYPERRAQPATIRVFVAGAFAIHKNRALLVKTRGTLLKDLWQFPSADGGTPSAALANLRRNLPGLGLRLDRRMPVAVTQHTIVHRRLEVSVYRAAPRNPKSKFENTESVRWFTASRLRSAAIPTLTRKIAIASGFLSAPMERILDDNASPGASSSARCAR
ncbi:MAG TPA: NUDIX domain-containing protein [Thermoanaerobaculia bacterium]|jgi:A/G-specific adenine glycosylase